jgi:hypothetical protein
MKEAATSASQIRVAPDSGFSLSGSKAMRQNCATFTLCREAS